MTNTFLQATARDAIANSTGYEKIARSTVAKKSTSELVKMFDSTEGRRDVETSLVRDWIMDEMFTRCPEEMDAWLDAYNRPMRDFIPA